MTDVEQELKVIRDRGSVTDRAYRRFGGGPQDLLAATATVTASGNTTVIAAPGVDSAIKFYWVSAVNDPDEATTPLIIFKASGGTEYYRLYAVAHWQPFTLPENEGLIVNLSGTASVAVTVHYEIVAV